MAQRFRIFQWQNRSVTLAAALLLTAGLSAQTPSPTPVATAAAPSLGQVMSLDVAMDLAEKTSFQYKVARQSTQEAESREYQTETMMLPRVDVDAQQVWINKDVNKLAGTSMGTQRFPDQVTKAGVQLSQPIIGLAPIFMKIKADAMTTKAARENEQQSRRDARFSGAQSYILAEKTAQLVMISQSSLNTIQKQHQDAEAMYRNGRISKADFLRFEIALNNAKNQLAAANSTNDMALFALAEVTGLDIGSFTIRTPEAPQPTDKLKEAESIQMVISKALENRSDYRSSADQIEIADYYLLAARLDFLPSLNGFVRYERDFQAKDINVTASVARCNASSPSSPCPVVPTDNVVATVKKEDFRDNLTYGLQLKWNIWDWGARHAKISEVSALVEKARIAREGTASKIRTEVAQAWYDLRAQRDAFANAKRMADAADEVYKLTNARFNSGAVTATDVINAEKDLTLMRGQLANAKGDSDLAWMKLQKVMGLEPSLK